MSNGIRKVGQQIETATDGSALDSALSGTKIPGNTSVDPEQYKGVMPDNALVDRTDGFGSQTSSTNVVSNNETKAIPPAGKVGRPSNNIDLANLNESMIMDIPFIHAKSFDIAALLNVKLRDPEYRPRWVNWKNNDGSNYSMFKSIGFVNARLEDVDQTQTPIGDHIVQEDGTIKYFDVILMKVNTIRLMQAYKANIQRSLQMVGRWSQSAIKAAKDSLANDVSPDMLEALKRAGHTVEFYAPSQEELNKDERDMNAGKYAQM